MTKYILLLFILASCCVAKGQEKGTLLPGTAKSFYGFPGESLPDSLEKHVWFLCSDTSQSVKGHLYDYEGSIRAMHFLFTIPGYIKQKKRGDNYNESFWMVTTDYWDENHKPIPKNYFIWQIQ